MSTTRIDVGDEVELIGTFSDKDGKAVDPTTVVCSVQLPDGTVVKPSVSKVEAGRYRALYSPEGDGDLEERLLWTMDGQGTNKAAAKAQTIVVRKRAIPVP